MTITNSERGGPLIESKRFVLSLGRFGRALGPKELVGEMRSEMGKLVDKYGATYAGG